MITEQNRQLGWFCLVDGLVRYGPDGRCAGPVTLVEESGREWLTLRQANGDVWTEFFRSMK
jgi:hypothetical protein